MKPIVKNPKRGYRSFAPWGGWFYVTTTYKTADIHPGGWSAEDFFTPWAVWKHIKQQIALPDSRWLTVGTRVHPWKKGSLRFCVTKDSFFIWHKLCPNQESN